MKKEINKWQLMWRFGRDCTVRARGWNEVNFGIFNLHHFPAEGEMVTKRFYRGFIIRFYVFLPIEFH